MCGAIRREYSLRRSSSGRLRTRRGSARSGTAYVDFARQGGFLHFAASSGRLSTVCGGSEALPDQNLLRQRLLAFSCEGQDLILQAVSDVGATAENGQEDTMEECRRQWPLLGHTGRSSGDSPALASARFRAARVARTAVPSPAFFVSLAHGGYCKHRRYRTDAYPTLLGASACLVREAQQTPSAQFL